MARPLGGGLSYWSFHTGMLRERAYRKIKGEFGIKGGYIYLTILNAVYEEEGYFLPWADDDCYDWSEEIGDGCSPQLVQQVISRCVKRSLFDERVFNMYGVLTSANVQRQFLNAVGQNRKIIPFIKEYWLLDENNPSDISPSVYDKLVFLSVNRTGNPENQLGNSDNWLGNEQSKVKESKVKESNISVPLERAREHYDYESVIESFNRICVDLPKVRELNDRRKKAIKSALERVEKYGGWDKLFESVQQSDFLTGRSGQWSNFGFDWILKPANLIKIIEGNYRNKTSPKQQPVGNGNERSYDLDEFKRRSNEPLIYEKRRK